MDFINIIQWLSVVGSLSGMWLVTIKKRIGFALWVLSSCGWITIFIHTGVYPRLVVEVPYAIMAAYGFYRWRRNGF